MAQLGSLGIAAFVLLAGVLVGPSQARACSGISCRPGTFFPVAGTVPANLKGIYWWPSFDFNGDEEADGGGVLEDSERVRLARVDGAAPELIDFTLQPISRELARGEGFLLVPETPFVAGASYVAWDVGCASGLSATTPPPYRAPEADFLYPFLIVEWSVARFDVAAAAPLPSELGAIVVEPQEEGSVAVGVSTGECTVSVDAIVSEVTLALTDSASPWADALFYETIVDGSDYEPQGGAQIDPFPGTALAGRAKELVYTRCDGEASEGVKPGTHRIELRGHVPGESLPLASNEARVTLTCPAPSDGGTVPAIDGGDDGSVGQPGGDGDGDGEGDGDDETDDDAARADSSGDGCSCRASGGSATSNAFVIALALLFVARRRVRA